MYHRQPLGSPKRFYLDLARAAQIENWCGFRIAVGDYTSNRRGRASKLKQQVHCILWAACYYHLWMQRNNARVNLMLVRPVATATQIINEVKHRIQVKCGDKISKSERVWLRKWEIAHE